ncbi:hypothetical protein SALBM311S_02704 [Streptomyces alboniger]
MFGEPDQVSELPPVQSRMLAQRLDDPPNVRRLSDDSGSLPTAPTAPSTTTGHLPHLGSRNVTSTVQSVTAYAAAAYAPPTW